MSDFTDSVERNLRGLEAVSVGACPGCKVCGLSDKPTESERAMADESHFSWSPCESCGRRLGGDRHPAHFLLPGWQNEPKGGRINHINVCVDCLLYIANGEEPESWEG